jgi:serine protease Do
MRWKKPLVGLLAGVFLFAWSGAYAASLPQFTKLAEKAGSAVVNISTVKVVETSKRLHRFFDPFHQDSPFDEFFKKFFEGMPEKRRTNSLGSGFIISKDGYIVTNHHVVAKADEIEATLRGSEESYPAEVVGSDPETDLALLKIDVQRDLPVLDFGNSDKLEPGEWVVAIGNPFGLDHTVTAGIISAKGRVIGAGAYDNFLQTDASINPGNSGGPLLNLDGEVVGINTAIVASGQGIGFAIPSNMAKEVIAQLKEYKKVRRGWLGVTIQDVDENTAKALGLSEPKGALVASIEPGDPAAQAGIQVGDVIIAVNGQSIEDARDLTRTIGQMTPGETIELTVWRESQVKEIQVKLGERSAQMAQREGDGPGPDLAGTLGMQLKPVNEREAKALGLETPQGLVVTEVKPGSPAAEAELRPGDVIIKANGDSVEQVAELERIVEASQQKGVVLLLIKRKGQNLFRTIPLP